LSTISCLSYGATALIYKGQGSCEEGCSESAALMATLAGLKPVYVSPSETGKAIFNDARVWIQPGGESDDAILAMNPSLKANLKEFVARGGGYVGFCAGAFMATSKIANTSLDGLGLIPGVGYPYLPSTDPDVGQMVPMQWGSKVRHLYFEGGPAFKIPQSTSVQVVGLYPGGDIAAIRALFYRGRVFVIGTHPEAPDDWKEYFQLKDRDGRDWDMAVMMIRWASSLLPQAFPLSR
jgi:glutamine amidotransferase-like uncharacterized protein